jgi:hypothetical protein
MADLTVTITEAVTLNSSNRGSTNSVTTTGINNVVERIVTCPQAATTTIATFSSNVYDSAGAIDRENVRYIRVTNLSTLYEVELGVGGAASNYTILLPVGSSHIIARAEDVMIAEADAVPSYGALADLAKLEVRPTTANDVNVELFVAAV